MLTTTCGFDPAAGVAAIGARAVIVRRPWPGIA